MAWEYPYPDCAWLVRALYEHFGPERLHWGSDYPVVRRAMTYRQSLEAVRTHCPFIPPEHKARILGDSLGDLFAVPEGVHRELAGHLRDREPREHACAAGRETGDARGACSMRAPRSRPEPPR